MSLLPCCRDAMALVTDAEEGALTGGAKLKFSVHLTICTVCQRMREQLRATKAVLRGLPPKPARESDVDAILELLGSPPEDADG